MAQEEMLQEQIQIHYMENGEEELSDEEYWNLLFEQDVEEIEKGSPVNEEDIYKAYLQAFHRLVYLLGTIHTMNVLLKEGQKVDKDYALYSAKCLFEAKEEFLKRKQEAGLEGGCNFMENSRFDGFEIKDSFFYGNLDTVTAITEPWIENFNPDKCYLYEVGMYIQFLAFQELTFVPEMLCEETEEIAASYEDDAYEDNAEEVHVEKCDKNSPLKLIHALWEKVKGGKKWKKLNSKSSVLVPEVPADTF